MSDVTARLGGLAPWSALRLRGVPWRTLPRVTAVPAVLAGMAVLALLAVVLAAALVEPVTWPLVALLAFTALTGATFARLRHRILYARAEAGLELELRATIRELRKSRARVVHVADAERRRIERDLHDGAQQRLIALRVKLALAEEIAAEESRSIGDLIHEISVDAETALEDLHALVHGIYPSLLTDRGLADAVKALARAAPIRARVLAEDVTRYGPDAEAAVYFTCAEALQNTAKHAGPGASSRIVLRHERGGLAFEVRDDGCGFDPGVARGSGLSNMQDRLGAVGGGLRIVAALDCGTVVQGWVPDAKLAP